MNYEHLWAKTLEEDPNSMNFVLKTAATVQRELFASTDRKFEEILRDIWRDADDAFHFDYALRNDHKAAIAAANDVREKNEATINEQKAAIEELTAKIAAFERDENDPETLASASRPQLRTMVADLGREVADLKAELADRNRELAALQV